MTVPDLALVSSSSPGFIRSVGAALGRHFRMTECYTQQETLQMLQLHRPKLAVIDLRGAPPKQTARTWAMIESTRGVQFTVVTNPGQLAAVEVPLEMNGRLQIAELGTGDTAMAEFTSRIVEQFLTVGRNDTGPQVAAAAPSGKDARLMPRPSVRTSASDHVSRAEPAGAPAGRPGTVRPVFAGAGRTAAKALSTDEGATSASLSDPSTAETSGSMVDRYRTRTPELRQMLRRLEIAARHNVTILLIGETGSGKTHLANLIHDVSPRAEQPFLHVACGALPGELIESELFGHVKGSFTSAHADKDGKFLAAGTGTILLDEIDVLTPDQQVKLLRVIEKGEFEPVGSNRTLHVRARIIAASNLQLQPLVESGRFRPDLYYRLNTLCFTIPPLRKRLPDIEPLARYFVHLHAAQLGMEVVEITPEFMDCLLSYPWPGNVREMENSIRSAVIYSDGGRMTVDTLPVHVKEGTAGPASDPSVAAFFGVRQGDSLGNRIELTEKDLIEQALLNNNFSRTNTARHLGISRVTLYNKMRKYGILPQR